MSQVTVKSKDVTITASLLNAESITSQHTGASLRQISISFRVTGPQQKQLLADLLQKKPKMEVGIDGPPAGQWAIGRTSYSYMQGDDTETHQWDLTEAEQIKVDALLLGDIEVIPTRYEERFDDAGTLTINARVRLSAEELQKIKALPLYFPVLRKGLNPTPLEMRFGRGAWSEHDGFTKASLTLIDRKHDTPARVGMLEPLISNIEVMLAVANEKIKILTEALEAKGITEPSLWDQSQKRLDAKLAGPLSELWRVDDLDKWPDDSSDAENETGAAAPRQ